MRNSLSNLFLILALLILTACTNSLVMEVDSAIPTATTDSTEAKVGLFLPAEFVNYVYRENTPDRENWEIALGKSQAAMFQQILRAVYGGYSNATSSESVEGYDRLITPKLLEMQLATPRETGFTFFEAWLNYTVTIRHAAEPRTQVLQLAAYGKQNAARFQRLQQGLHQAIEQALRDAGAKLTVKLTQSEIK